ncbi:MAG: MATE family efflux transporter [Clostridia bacterium]
MLLRRRGTVRRVEKVPGPITSSEIFTLAWPAVLEMTLHMLTWVVDVAMVGRLGANALGAVSLGGQIFFAVTFFLGSIGVGMTALVARRWGSGDTEAASRAAAAGIFSSTILGILATVSIYFAAPSVFALAGFGSEATTSGIAYMRFAAPAALFMIPTAAINGVMRGTGDTRTPLLVTTIGNVVNIVGDYFLIFGVGFFPTMGVAGAAVAFSISQLIAAGFACYALSLRRRVHLSRQSITHPDPGALKSLLAMSLPAGISVLLMDSARTVTTFIIASRGEAILAAHQVAVTAEALSFMPGYGFALAAGVITGQSLGANNMARARAGVRECARIAALVMGSIGLLFLILPKQLVGLFSDDPALVPLAASCLRIAAFVQIPVAISEVLAGALRGAGDTRSGMLVAALGSWGLRVPLVWMLMHYLGLSLVYIWMGMVFEWLVRTAILWAIYRRERWTTIEM